MLFQKVIVLPKDSFPKLKGSLCNILIDSTDIANVLRRVAEKYSDSEIKKHIEFSWAAYFEAVNSNILHNALLYLLQRNSVYHDIAIV